jgi:hypothetical protein
MLQTARSVAFLVCRCGARIAELIMRRAHGSAISAERPSVESALNVLLKMGVTPNSVLSAESRSTTIVPTVAPSLNLASTTSRENGAI